MTQEQEKAFHCVKETLSESIYKYGENAYRLGYSDGMEVSVEQGINREKSILSLDDMTNLIVVYDAVRKLNNTLVGVVQTFSKEEGVLGALSCVFDVINSGVCADIKLLGGDKALKKIIYILDKEEITP